ncbi:MAG TPA: trans-aconitate 2-methyltransferase [Nannocystis sp.]
MPSWNAEQYLRFADERTRPCRDLVAALALVKPRRIVDLGCGPGSSAAVLAQRWPAATIVGLDSSEAMIAAAREKDPAGTWVVGDIATWEDDAAYDLVFSNAALHWVADHAAVFPRLLSRVAAGGALAVQMPYNLDAPAQQAMREIARRPEWRGRLGDVRTWHVEPAATYYDLLSPLAARVDIWVTEYVHVLPDAAAIVAWYRGSGLRPYLDRLPDPDERERFLAEYLAAITAAHPAQRDGRVLLLFRRLFVVAYR